MKITREEIAETLYLKGLVSTLFVNKQNVLETQIIEACFYYFEQGKKNESKLNASISKSKILEKITKLEYEALNPLTSKKISMDKIKEAIRLTHEL